MSLPTGVGPRRVSRVGTFNVTNPLDVIQKRISRGIPWEPHLFITERFISHLIGGRFGKYQVIDVGANQGTFTLHAAKSADGVMSMEPNPEALELLKTNLALNAKIKNVTVFSTVIGDLDGRPVTVIRELENNLGAYQLKAQDQGDSESYYSLSLDSIFMRQKNDFVLIKIDVEGMESAVIDGCVGIIGQRDCALLVEVWGKGQADFLSKMRSLGFRAMNLRRDDFIFLPI